MGGSAGKSKNQSQNTGGVNYGQDIWGGQQGALGDLYKNAGGLWDMTKGAAGEKIARGSGFESGVMNDQRGAMNDAISGGVYQDMGIGNQLMDSLNQSQNSPSNMQDINSMIMGGQGNNYADAMKSSYISDADRAQKLMLGNLDARASASGMSGGARQGVAQAQGMNDINRNLQQNLASTGYQAFDKDLDRKLNIAQQADQNNFGRQQLMSNMLGSQQQTQNAGMGYGQNLYNQSAGSQMMPWQQAGMYSNIIGRPTVLGSGSGYGSGNSSAKGMSLSGQGGGF